MVNILMTTFYMLLGVMFLTASIQTLLDKTNPVRFGTSLFWLINAVIFSIGQWLGYEIVGILVVITGLLLLCKQVKVGHIKPLNKVIASKSADKLGAWIFVPSFILAILAIVITKVGHFGNNGSQIGIGIAAIISLIFAMVMAKSGPKTLYEDTQRMVRQVGSAGIQPQLLAMLGVIFTASGVGKIVSQTMAGVFPPGNHLLGVTVYCVAMALFTFVMGDAFAAFAVITTAIGVPFVIAQGGSPVVVASIGMIAGYCGTLLTPMSAAFNSLPVGLLKIHDSYGVIKKQILIALIMLLVQIITMYFLAF
ncbi:DUF979 domain-containing protein [Acetilactobacillus jinshanensis]|uniref:DUF979 domain-containing protein n=1 Tax=Acetilactobacillus jinshanensis TaxID=1720083 RepID=A0A4V1ALQ2_9LACO|nr:DUF979 domain-containing protein [Acetilactobacillus jinshanensis]QBP18389.1 DUF979 domain-containing protein [Acetilactobacillus jinshanensis]URL61259.1 DUF979 domain-containing protein [uncultured bacterium]